jgi:ribonuclease M5
MQNKKLSLKHPVIVEGKYDKIKLSNIVSTPIIALNGFSVFNSREKLALLRRLSAEKGLIVLTDSDNAGMFIRSRLKGLINADKLINIYVPIVKGKEKRKYKPSKEGILGVEGIDSELLYSLLERFAEDTGGTGKNTCSLTSAEFYADGFSGADESAKRRKKLAQELNLPESMTSKALLEAINLLVKRSEYELAKDRVTKEMNREGL